MNNRSLDLYDLEKMYHYRLNKGPSTHRSIRLRAPLAVLPRRDMYAKCLLIVYPLNRKLLGGKIHPTLPLHRKANMRCLKKVFGL